MKYDSKNANKVIPEGEYEATIKAYTDRDDAGQPLRNKNKTEAACRVVFEVYLPTGTTTVTQQFTEKSTLFMYRALAKALGQYEAFQADRFCAGDHIGDALVLGVKIKPSEQYGDQNQFVFKPKAAASATGTTSAAGGATPITEDDIPFDPQPAMFT